MYMKSPESDEGLFVRNRDLLQNNVCNADDLYVPYERLGIIIFSLKSCLKKSQECTARFNKCQALSMYSNKIQDIVKFVIGA